MTKKPRRRRSINAELKDYYAIGRAMKRDVLKKNREVVVPGPGPANVKR